MKKNEFIKKSFILLILMAITCVGFLSCKNLNPSLKLNSEIQTFTQVIDSGVNQETLYNINLNFNGGTLNGKTSDVVSLKNSEKNNLLNIKPQKKHFDFVGWCVDETCLISFDYSQDLTADIELFAKWEQTEFKVSFDANGGILTSNSYVYYKKGTKIEIPTSDPRKSGFIFLGWYSDEDAVVEWNFNSLITADVTLYAGWVEAINIEFNDGEFVGSLSVPINSKVSDIKGDIINASRKASNHVLYGIYSDETYSTELGDDYVLTDKELVYAKFVCLNIKEGNSDFLNQEFNYLTKPIVFTIEVREGQTVELTTSAGFKYEFIAECDEVYEWVYYPERLNVTYTYCKINGQNASGDSYKITMRDSVPYEMVISVDAVFNKKNFKLIVEDGKFYNAQNITWYKTEDKLSDVYDIEIGTGTEISVKLTTDCKVRAVYNNGSQNFVISNSIDVMVDNYFDAEIIVVTIITLALIGTAFVILIITFKKYKVFF